MSSFAHPHHASLVKKDGRMSSALRSSFRPYEAAEEMVAAAAAGAVAWGAAERGAGDGFSVEDLLDLEELCDVDKDGAGEHGEATPVAAEKEKEKSSDSHGSSVVSYEPMPLLPPVMDLPAHDVEELEWVSRIMDDSLAELPVPTLPVLAACNNKPQHRRTPQEAGALVPMRTPTICALSTEALVPVKSKKRSKRSRASVWSLSGTPMSDSASSSSTATTSSCSSSASFSSFLQFVDFPALVASDLLDEHPRSSSKKSKHGKNGGKPKPKKRGRKPKHQQPPHLAAAGGGGGALVPAPSDRRCSHCGVQKTPQWRAGPEGAKTLCNACGVRYKSGRLLPEYRPACSPSYVSSLHSNSHRKVLEMRRKKEGVIVAVAAAAAPAVASF